MTEARCLGHIARSSDRWKAANQRPERRAQTEDVSSATLVLPLSACLCIPNAHCAALYFHLCVDQFELLGGRRRRRRRRRRSKDSGVGERNACLYIELHGNQLFGIPLMESRPLTGLRSLRRDAWSIA